MSCVLSNSTRALELMLDAAYPDAAHPDAAHSEEYSEVYSVAARIASRRA